MLKKLRKNKKGFTLVEVIVVLVILAILAAIMVPSMTGWIDKAKDQSILVEGRTALLAAQTCVSEVAAGTSTSPADQTDVDAAEFAKLAPGVTLDGTGEKHCTFEVTNWEITTLVYTSGTKTATYDGTTWTVA